MRGTSGERGASARRSSEPRDDRSPSRRERGGNSATAVEKQHSRRERGYDDDRYHKHESSRQHRSSDRRSSGTRQHSSDRRDAERHSSSRERRSSPPNAPVPEELAAADLQPAFTSPEADAVPASATERRARASAAEKRNSRERAIVESAFRHFDTDGSGFIEKGELAGLAKELGYALSREELKALLRDMDTDGKPDGRISLKEFSDWWIREFGASSVRDRVVKAVLRLWLKIRSAAAEAAPVGCAGVGWGGQFGWRALTSTKSALSSGDLKISVGWNEECSEVGKMALEGCRMPKEDYQAAMEELRAPGNTVAVFTVTLAMRESTPAEDMKALQKSLSAVLGHHCAAMSEALTASASAFGIENGGELGDSPARGGGVAFASLRPRVQFSGEGSAQGAQEYALEATVFAGGLLFESIVATLAKAGLTFTDFPTFKIDCSSSQSLRQLLARGPQHLLSALKFKLDVTWDIRRRLIRKLLGLTEAASPVSLILGSMLISLVSEISLHGPAELLSEVESARFDEELPSEFASKTGMTSPLKESPMKGDTRNEDDEEECDWRVALQRLTGKQLKAWIKRGLATADVRMEEEGRDAERKALSLLKRHALYLPTTTLFIAGAKLEITQAEDAPMVPLETLLNPDLADIAAEGDQ